MYRSRLLLCRVGMAKPSSRFCYPQGVIRKYPQLFSIWKQWRRSDSPPFFLSAVRMVRISDWTRVALLVVSKDANVFDVRGDTLEVCLTRVFVYAEGSLETVYASALQREARQWRKALKRCLVDEGLLTKLKVE